MRPVHILLILLVILFGFLLSVYLFDWNLSRGMARSIAEEYRSPLDKTGGYPGDNRQQAAAALERFAEELCEPQAVHP
jgi:hypothetical protein